MRTARRPRREVIVGASTRIGLIGARLFPAMTERVSARLVHRQHFTDTAAARTQGNVLAPRDVQAQIDGGWRNEGRRRRVRRCVTVALALGAGAALLRRWSRR